MAVYCSLDVARQLQQNSDQMSRGELKSLAMSYYEDTHDLFDRDIIEEPEVEHPGRRTEWRRSTDWTPRHRSQIDDTLE